MHPLLFNLGPVPIHTYGVMIAIGFLLGTWVIKRLAMRSGLDIDHVIDLTFWALVVGFAGARLLFIVTQWQLFASDPLAMLRVWEGGLVFLGGPLAVVPFSIWFMRRYKLPAWATLDAAMPGLTIGHAFGRVGCLASGCCYGSPTHTDFGVKLYSELVEPSLRGVNLHPTQLYEAGALLVLFAGLLWVHRRRVFDGQVALTYFIAYPVIRSIIEIFRGDFVRGFVIDGILSTSQFLSLLIFAAASTALALRLRYLRHGHGSPVAQEAAQ